MLRELDLQVGRTFDLADSDLATTPGWFFGVTAVIAHCVDVDEHRRRLRNGTGPLRSLELLDVLMDLPAREPVPLASLTRPTVQILNAAPPGTVTFTDTTVVRQAIPAVTPVLAIVRTTTSRFHDGLARASLFAAYCPQLLVVREAPDNATEVLAEASWYGIGVAVGPRNAATVLVEPQPVTDWQPTPAWWKFAETVYQYRCRTPSMPL